MNRTNRMNKLEIILDDLRIVSENYLEQFPAHFMISHARGFIHSLIRLESEPSEHSQKMIGVITRDDEHRELKIENGKVMELK